MKPKFSIYKKVLMLMREDKKYCDSDERLVVRVWREEVVKDSEMTAAEFLRCYVTKQVTSADTITRCRRKAQQRHVSLRGATWLERKTKHVDAAKVELRGLK